MLVKGATGPYILNENINIPKYNNMGGLLIEMTTIPQPSKATHPDRDLLEADRYIPE